MPQLTLRLLGPPQVELDGQALHISRRKALALLAYLAVTRHAHQRDALATLFWPEHDQSSARAELRRTLSQLNRALGEGWLAVDRETAGLDPAADVWLDVDALQDRLAQCEAHDHPRDHACPDCLPLLEEAVELYRDDFLAGFTLRDSAQFDEWQFFQTQSLRDALAGALERLANAYGEREAYEQAISRARHWLSLDPQHEPAHRALMRLYAQAGQRAAALRQYRACVRALEEELGLPPAEETTTLYARIHAERPPGPQEERAPAAIPPPPRPDFLAEEADAEPQPPVFVARERELARLDGLLGAALSGEGRVAFVTGGPGRGKTALLGEFARRAMAAHPDLLVACGNCNAYSGIGDPYLPFREALGMLTGDVASRRAARAIAGEHARRLWDTLPLAAQTLLEDGPALIGVFLSGPALLSRATAATSGGEGWLGQLRDLIQREADASGLGQDHLFEQVTNVLCALAAQRPLLIVLDDLQWADTASTSLLFHLGRRLEAGRILILGAYRPEEVALGRDGGRHPLQKVLSELKRRFGDVWVDLTRTDEAEGRRLVEGFVDTEPNRLGEGFRSALFGHTRGHPLFTVELLRAMQERGDLRQDEDGRWIEGPALDWETLPARVEGVIKERIGRLEEELREALSVASVEGEAFTAQVVARVQAVDERQLLRALSRELEKRHRLVREGESLQVGERRLSRYWFTHALFQQYVYNDLGAGERRLLHGEVAHVLEALYEGCTDEVAAQLAHHYTEAGEREKAVEYLSLAGDRARLAYAHQEAATHYRWALATLKELGRWGRAARTLMKLGTTYHSAFQFAEARQTYDEGFALWQRAGEKGPTDLPPAPHALRLPWVDPTTLDPASSMDEATGYVLNHLFSGLLEGTPDMSVVPDVAERWEIRADGREYVFHLRDDVRWSDGTPLTAEDFAYAWRRVLDPVTGSPYAGNLYCIQGARAFHEGEAAWEEVGVCAMDAVTLAVELETPDSRFLERVGAETYALPVPRHVIEAYSDRWTEEGHLVTNGPFRLESWDRGERMAFARNRGYHGQFTGNVEHIELHLSGGDEWDTLGLAWYEADALDVIWRVTPRTLEYVRHRHPGEYISQPEASTDFVGFDLRRRPFDDRRVRRALALATDRDLLADVVLRGAHFPATGGFIPLGVPGHSPGIGLPYDPARARGLLVQAGYPDGRGFPVVEALTTGMPSTRQYLQEQWRENLSIEIAWTVLEMGEFADRLTREPPQIFLTGWGGGLDPGGFVAEGGPWLRWQDETYVELLEQARRAGDPKERIRLYAQADTTLVEAAAVVPLFYERRHRLLKPWITRWPSNPVRGFFWKDVVIEPH
jgi:ABC-type transport system substrate-binding protein